MVETCSLYGITPLTRQEFEAEDKRIYVELVRRRHGLGIDAGPVGPPYCGIYT